MTDVPALKSYLLDQEEREALLREGGMNVVYLAESQAAGRAGDEEPPPSQPALPGMDPDLPALKKG